MTAQGLTVLNRYRLIGPPEGFDAAIVPLAARVRAEGDPGVLAYRFFVDPDGASARAVIDYAGPGAWIGHHEIAMGWPEMAALHAVARLEEIVFLGPVPQEIRDWLAASSLTAEVRMGLRPAAGFDRRG